MEVLQLFAYKLKVTCTEIKQVLLGDSFCLENVFPTKIRALPALFLPLSPG